MLRRCILACAGLALASCAPALAAVSEAIDAQTGASATSAVQTVDVAADKIVLNGTRSLIVAHNAYQGAAAALTPIVGLLPASTLNRIEELNNLAVDRLTKADSGLSAAARAAQVFDIVTELDAIRERRR